VQEPGVLFGGQCLRATMASACRPSRLRLPTRRSPYSSRRLRATRT
jgi:hypothetical protein